MSRSRHGPSPSDVVEDGPRTDVTDVDELREELLALVEDAEAASDGDTEASRYGEGRIQQLLSDWRREMPAWRNTGGGD